MRVAVLGGGYAGVTLARRLERLLDGGVEIVVADDTGEHLVQHELHRAIRRPSAVEEIAIPLEDLLDRSRVVVGRVEDVDPAGRTATLADGTSLEYDVGAVCLGAEPAYYGIPGVREHGTPLKRVDHAARIRQRFLDLLEAGGTVVVAGAGLSGIQAAGELAALAREEGFEAGPGADVRILLVEQRETVAPGFRAGFREAVRDELQARGVEIRTGTTVRSATGDRIDLSGDDLAYDQLVWTGGIAGPAALGGERPAVDAWLRLADRTLALGDAVRVVDADGEVVPASAQAAVREARTAARNVGRLVEHERDGGIFEPRLEPFAFDPAGWLVSVGDGAVAQVGPAVFAGAPAVALKETVGVGYASSVRSVREAVEAVNERLGPGARR